MLEEVPGIQEPRGVQEDHLGPVGGEDSGNPLPGRLGLGRDDAEAFTQKRIHQGGLPGVGPPYERHVAGSGILFSEEAVGVRRDHPQKLPRIPPVWQRWVKRIPCRGSREISTTAGVVRTQAYGDVATEFDQLGSILVTQLT